MMKRLPVVFAVIALPVAAMSYAPAANALTSKEKMETCKFGADDQKLQGKAKSAFLAKCMANEKAAKPAAKTAPKPAS